MQHHLDFGLCPSSSVPRTTQYYGKWMFPPPCKWMKRHGFSWVW
jgi:hypothetical protein